MENHLRLKGLLQSDDGGKTWFVRRIDYLTGSDCEYGQFDYIEVPNEWKPCLLVLKKVSK